MKNLFFTGERGVGKSTLLNRLLKDRWLQTGGFRTLPFAHEDIGRGFYLLGSNEPPLPAPGPERVIALRTDEGRIQQRFTEVFETLGVNLLTHCLDNHPDIIVMDELGFLESEATTFQQRVFSCLDAPVPVWGVIKPLSTPFLDGIRERKDVTVLTITIDNRDRLYNELTEKKKAVSFRTSKGGIEMDLCYRIWLTNDGKAFGKGPYDLLMAVSQYGSLNEAAKKMGMSYSKAWKVINMIEGRLGFALLRRETGGSGGGGSYLTTEAKDFLKKYSQFLAEADQALTDLFQKHFGETSF